MTGQTGEKKTEEKQEGGEASFWEIYFPFRNNGSKDVVYVASFPPIVYLWPSIVILFFCAILQAMLGAPSSFVGWMVVLGLFVNLLVLVQDFDQKQFLIVMFALLSLVLGVWILGLYGFTFVQTGIHWLFGFEPLFSHSALFLLGFSMLVLFLWGLIGPAFDYWRLEPNEFVHYVQPVGRDISIARAGCTVNKEIPDVLECLLSGGGGTLVIRRDQQVLATIPHIPFLARRMKLIEELLSETRVVVSRESSSI